MNGPYASSRATRRSSRSGVSARWNWVLVMVLMLAGGAALAERSKIDAG